MNSTIRQLAEIVGVIAVTLSLLFVGYELRLSREIALSAQRNNAVELTRALHEYIAENADVWERGCMDEELATDEAIVFTNMVQAIISHQFGRYQQGGSGFSNIPLVFPTRALAFNMYNFQGFKKEWEKAEQRIGRRGSSGFGSAVIEEYELLVESDAVRVSDVSLCGI